jgi:TRAP-type mannitol/chloroaromatic compound transport system substrate-binding protein
MPKKLLMLAMALATVAAVVAAGCAPAPTTPTTPTTPTSPTTPTTPTTPSQPSTEKFNWTIQVTYPLGMAHAAQQKVLFEERLPRLTGGRFQGQVLEPGAIVPAYEGWTGTNDGALDAVFITASDERGKFGPVCDLFNQYAGPAPTGPEMATWIHAGDGLDLLRQTVVKAGFDNVHVVGLSNIAGAEDELWSNKKIESIDSYNGLKIRTFGYWGEILQAVGASVVTMPGGEVYQGMERGVIDACELGEPGVDRGLAMHEVADYLYYPGTHSPGNVHYIVANKASWDKLPDDLQYILERELMATALQQQAELTVLDALAIEFFIDYGVEFLELPTDCQAYIVTEAGKLWERFASEDDWYKTVYDNQQAFLKMIREGRGLTTPNFSAIMEYADAHGMS